MRTLTRDLFHSLAPALTTFATVVVGVDFSAGSDAALAWASGLAARAGAALHVVHATVPRDSGVTGGPREHLEQLLDAVGPVPAGGVAPAVAVGRSVPDALARYAVSVGAGILVVGTHGRSGLDRLLMGSVAEACVATAPCPVLTVPRAGAFTEPSPAAPVLVAVDFTAASRDALTAGQSMARLHGAPVELVHVVCDAGPYTGLVPSALTLAGIDDVRDAAVRRRLERFASGGDAPGALHAALGEPSRQIAALARARGAGAVVMGTHGRGGVAHMMLGSTAGATIQRAPCPVLTVQSSPTRVRTGVGRIRAVA